ncbi:hypothetical protein SAMN02745157_2525 [Kaistia soli DSM 19436]|uniref:Phage terminase-like protein, large subunit, contains N-terminal HTH domain n=2 Tax=Kaistia TaxID=166953 RepID=A0A1M5D0R2_9HYPH|nr:hypothetical protein SAMN02745157_2525 [Kaistia soli DSM 19436]
MADPALLGGAIPGESWLPWRTLLIAAMGEPLTDDERTIFTALTGRDIEPLEQVEELWCIVGRRGGKTRAAGTLAAYVAGLCDHSDALAPGERGVLPIMAASTDQATRAFHHVVGILNHSPVLRSEVQDQLSDVIRLGTAIDVQIRPANFRTLRGITAVGAIGDEVAFWSIEGSVNPDSEILDALRPALATTGGPLVVISSPYARRGELWAAYKRHYGPKGDPRVLVAKGPSRTFNPTLKQSVVDRAYERDAAVASAEYGGEFRTDVEALLTREAVEACVSPGVRERGAVASTSYFAFVDPSGGSADSFTMCIGHRDDRVVVIDAIRERKPPFSPEGVVEEYCTLLKSYRVNRVSGDRYAGEWPREQFRKHDIQYEVAVKAKSDLYRDLLPVLNSRNIDLLDHDRLVTQLIGLERRTARGGRDSIDHAPGAHDDIANAVAGCIQAKRSFNYDWVA